MHKHDVKAVPPEPDATRRGVPENVHADCAKEVIRDKLTLDFAEAVRGMFTINGCYHDVLLQGGRYTTCFCKPTQALADARLLNREVLALFVGYLELDPRTVSAVKDIITQKAPRLSPDLAIVLHIDPDGATKLREWGASMGITVVPVLSMQSEGVDRAQAIRAQLTAELMAADPFLLTGPVRLDRDFFGRRENAADFLNQLRAGRIRSMFGIRKIGKTSILNRIVDLARRTGEPQVAVVDCSAKQFHTAHATDALGILASTLHLSAKQGYASISDPSYGTNMTLRDLLHRLARSPQKKPLAVLFDEVDYITPSSPAQHWKTEFNDFWREFRVFVQEAQRNQLAISVLVSGVSSKHFQVATVSGVENSALHFVPNEYLAPFDRVASASMIAELAKRCGLRFSAGIREKIADTCANMPFWIRAAGSYLHKNIDLKLRPLDVPDSLVNELLTGFTKSDGLELVTVALAHLQRTFPEAVELLGRCVTQGRLPVNECGLLLRYGLVTQSGPDVVVSSDLVANGARELVESRPKAPDRPEEPQPAIKLYLATGEWAEELASLSKRRNVLERTLRQFVPNLLRWKIGMKNWPDEVRQCLDSSRRTTLSTYSASALMDKLYWLELAAVVSSNWSHFQVVFGDKARFERAIALLNDRPDAHAKDTDGADLALYRHELTWLEERIAGQ